MFNINTLVVTAQEFTRNNMIMLTILFIIICIMCIEILKNSFLNYKAEMKAERAIQRELRHNKQYNSYDELLDIMNTVSPVEDIYRKYE